MNRRRQIGSLVALILLASSATLAGTLDLSWSACDAPDLAGYRVHVGASPDRYDRAIVTREPRLHLEGLADDTMQYIRVEAFARVGRSETETLALSAELRTLPAPVVRSVGPLLPAGEGVFRTVISGTNISPNAVVRLRTPALALRGVTAVGGHALVAEVVPVARPGLIGLPSLDADSIVIVNPARRRPAYFDAEPLRADVNGDGRFDAGDLAAIEAGQGQQVGGSTAARAADLNGDGLVDGTDLAFCSFALSRGRAAATP